MWYNVSMKREDNRTLSPATQYHLRKQVVRLKSAGRSSLEVSEITGLSRQSVNATWKRYQSGGLAAIKLKPRGRSHGAKRRLTADQERELKQMMADKTPEQFKFKFALWTRTAVQAVAKKVFHIDLPLRTISDYLNRWGFSAQKPIKRAYERNPQAVAQWLASSYPAIVEQAKKQDAEINWGDETGIEADDYVAKGFAPKGKTPVVRLPGSPSRTRVNMISAITNQGKVRFMLYEEKMNSTVFIKFIKRLIKDAHRKIFLIVDNLKVHHSEAVKKWSSKEDIRNRLELFYLPSYAPDLNPDEHLNSDLKYQVHSGLVGRTKAQVKGKVRSAMKIIQKRPERVKKYFEDPAISYAA
jgi:transposase